MIAFFTQNVYYKSQFFRTNFAVVTLKKLKSLSYQLQVFNFKIIFLSAVGCLSIFSFLQVVFSALCFFFHIYH